MQGNGKKKQKTNIRQQLELIAAVTKAVNYVMGACQKVVKIWKKNWIM